MRFSDFCSPFMVYSMHMYFWKVTWRFVIGCDGILRVFVYWI
jgi:hypothetical protein